MFIYQVVFCLSRLFAAVGIVSPVSIPAIAPHSLHIRPFFYSVIPASEPGSWAALCEVLHCAVALPSSSSPAPPRVRLRANWAAVRQSVQARLRSPCTNCPHQVRDDGAIAPLYHCLRHCHPRQRLPGCRLGGRHDGAVCIAVANPPPGCCSPLDSASPPYPPPGRPASGAAKIHTV